MLWVKEHRATVAAFGAALLLCASLFAGAGTPAPRRAAGERERSVREGEDEDGPASDHPDEAIRFRNLQLQDEHGRIPLDGLQKAKAHVEVMKAAQQKRLKAQPQPRAPKSLTPQAVGAKPNSWVLMEPESAGGLAGAEAPVGPRPEAAGVQPNSWTWLGPGNVGGRIRAIAIHPTNPSSMWVGSVSGGIWHSSDAGASWRPVNDFMANLAVSTLIIDPTNPNVMYAGTGEAFTTSRECDSNRLDCSSYFVRGGGVFKSTDGGVTWNLLPRTNPADVGVCADAGPNCSWSYVNRLAISPNGRTLLAATINGIWRSSDAGATWQNPVVGNAWFDVDFDPSNSQNAIASGIGASFSTDGGQTFSPSNFADFFGAPAAIAGRVETAYAPSNPSIVYAGVDRNLGELYRSADGGKNFSLVNGKKIPPITGTRYLGSQGGYDNAIWVNPKDPTNVIVGGIDLWESFNSGQNLTQMSMWQCGPGNPGSCNGLSAHADQHMILSHPRFNDTSNRTVYFSNDGGLFRKNDSRDTNQTSGWINLNNGLGITQFYGAAANPNSGQIMGGAQDNGTTIFSGLAGSAWSTTFGGDGGFCAADPRDRVGHLYFYGEYVNATVFRSTDGGASADYIYCDPSLINPQPPLPPNPSGVCPQGKGIDDAKNGANFIAPLTLAPSNPDTLLVGGLSLWRSRDVKTTPIPTWEAIKPPASNGLKAPANVPISTIAVSPNTSSFILVGDNVGRIFLTLQGDAGAATVNNSWRQISKGLPPRFVTSIAIDNTKSPNWIYATFGGFSPDNIYRSTDLGKTWQDVTGSGITGLPDVPVRSLAIHPRDPNLLYVGTEIGVFTSEDAGATWEVPQEGPANVSVDQVFWVTEEFGGDDLFAVTHGRGIYVAAGGIYVDASYTGAESGTFLQPFRTITKAVNAARTYQPIWIRAGTYSDTLTINKPLELRSRGGLVVIGKQ
ncbi:MAG: DUF1565 domain-containing protein [Acidobacteria bacterium]|nr:DUF1565 domain-containing protein [Acidobacteriota bacterium]